MAADSPAPQGNSADKYTLTIGSRLEQLAMVHALIGEIARQYGFGEEMETALLVAVIEAGTNAIQHGNAFDDHKTVLFQFRVRTDDISIQVDDYGTGFDPAKVGDPTDASRLLNPHGRGLYLMRELMDEVTFSVRPDNGTTVLLRKTRPLPSS